MFSFLLGGHLGGKWLGYMVSVCLTFYETAKLFSKALVSFSIPISDVFILIITKCLLTKFLRVLILGRPVIVFVILAHFLLRSSPSSQVVKR